MRRFASWLVDYPVVSGALLVLVTVALGLQIPRLQLDESAEGLMVEHDPARRFYEQMKERFGSDNLTIVLVKADDVFAPGVLEIVRRLTDGLERIEGVSRVDSLTNVKNIKGRDDTLDTEPMVPTPVPTAAAELARIRGDALDNRVLVGNLVSPDARATALTVYVAPPPPAARDTGFNQRLVDRIDALLRDHSAPGVTAFQVGVPLTKATYVRYLEHHLRITPPLGLAVLVIVLFLCFRTLQGVVVPILTATVSIAWAMGLMAILGIPLTVLTGIIPSLLLAIGFTEDVHMLTDLPRAAPAGRGEARRDPEHARGDGPAHPRHGRDHDHRVRQPGHHRHQDGRPVRLCRRARPHGESHHHAGGDPDPPARVARASAPRARLPPRASPRRDGSRGGWCTSHGSISGIARRSWWRRR